MKRLVLLLLLLALPCAAMADQTITVTFTGDVTLGGEGPVQKLSDSFTGYYETYGPDYFLKNLQVLMANDDLTVINLEGVLSNSTANENTKKQYRFRAPASYTNVLTSSSVELCGLSNNHTADFGTNGLKNTKIALEAAGLGYTIYKKSYVFEKNGIRIGFISMYAGNFNGGSDWLRSEVKSLKSTQGCSAVVVSVHGGTEYAKKHGDSQTTMAEISINAGADLVVMHHPHILEGCEIMKNRYVFYSLGNTCFGGNDEVRALETAILQVDFVFSDSGTYKGQQVRIYPAHTSGTYPRSNFQPVLVTGTEATEVLKLIQYDTKFTLEPFDETTGCVTQPFLSAKGDQIEDETPVASSTAE